ncbi:MAG: arylsulfatase, partial [Verrucomicrobia bacterium]|nr:arylsulfatase [Verrucomicrobiota bacterium]
MRFMQFYAGSTVCAPSRSVLMTGQHTGHTRVRGNAGPKNPEAQMLRPEDVTVAKVLKRAGYATGIVGKWGLGDNHDDGIPTKQGFDYWFGFLNQVHAHNHYPDWLWRNEEKVQLPNVVTPVGEMGGGYATQRVKYAGDLFAEEALQFVERNKDKPFFLYYAATVPHANNERTRALGDGQEVPDYGVYKDKDWSDPDKGQAAMITRLDTQIGQLFARLKQLGLDERTLVIFSSDNGPHKEGGNDPALFQPSGPVRGMKRDLTDGGIRVPFIARWPGHVKAGTLSAHVGYFGDFMATAAELAGAPAPAKIDSISFVPTLLGKDSEQKKHDHLYWEFFERGFSQAVLMEGRWKAIRLRNRNAPVELYDLANDLGEQNSVAAQHADLGAKAAELFKTARTESPLWPVKDGMTAGAEKGKKK